MLYLMCALECVLLRTRNSNLTNRFKSYVSLILIIKLFKVQGNHELNFNERLN